ncbi:MAG: SGNH/GDSL hydrolase family protein [Deltaproteobacteria bacterium]|nr:SGNH/GDSL hydrolase family protein [Deltaproteobacteria bacterium]
MLETAKELNVPVLDLNKIMWQGPPESAPVLDEDIVHLNVEGHRRVGECIADFIVDNVLTAGPD